MVADLHKLAAGREDYYTREIARNREEYLSGKGESPGQFHGGSARALGLNGECSPAAFKRLFAWQDPRTGEQLGRAPAPMRCRPGTWCSAPTRTCPSCTPWG